MSWIAMRYVEGQPLSAMIAAARSPQSPPTSSDHLSFVREPSALPPPSETVQSTSQTTTRTRDEISRVVRIFEQTARALHVAHENGVIHRDIKPANIMIGPDDAPVILDFGLANVMEPEGATLTRSGDLMGTPQYMAPELLTHDAIHVDRRADIYSLGVSLYEALTLARPFDAPTRERLYQAIIAKEAPDPRRLHPEISRDLSAIIATAIEKDRDRRYQTALHFAEDLRRVIAREPVVARRAGPLTRVLRWAERNPMVAVSLSALFVVLLAGLGVTLYFLGRANDALVERQKAIVAFENLSDVKRLRDLRAAAEPLLEPTPDHREPMADWIKRAEDIASRLPIHEAALAQLGGADTRGTSPRRLEDEWKREYLTELVSELKAMADPDPHLGLLADMRNRLAKADAVRKRSVDDFGDRWRAAAASIADVAQSPRYGGLRVSPQLGLVPLGRNADTGLWEFADVWTGDLPEPNAYGAYEFDERSAVVLVLLPGGTFRMGSPDHELRRGLDEDLHDVTLPAFFIGKYEVTQFQWSQIMRNNPSEHDVFEDHDATAHPVEGVSWDEALEFARRIGMTLPTEEEWEYGCRAGATTAYTWGNDDGVLENRANVADQSAQTLQGGRGSIVKGAPWKDGYSVHAPVHAFAANAFGLFGLHGNVGEWCFDWYRPAGRAGEKGRRVAAHRSWRDGCWLLPPSGGRCAARHGLLPTTRSATLGLRVARPLDP